MGGIMPDSAFGAILILEVKLSTGNKKNETKNKTITHINTKTTKKMQPADQSKGEARTASKDATLTMSKKSIDTAA